MENRRTKSSLLEQNYQPVCTISNERFGIDIFPCSKCHCKIHYKFLLLQSYQLYNFIKRKRKYSWAKSESADVSAITRGSVDIEINELKDKLSEIGGISTFLREENQKLREENTIITNSKINLLKQTIRIKLTS